MSEHQKTLKKQQKASAKAVAQQSNHRPANPEIKSNDRQNSGEASADGQQAFPDTIQMTYEEAEEQCRQQMAQFEEEIQKNQDLTEQEKEQHLLEAQETCKKYLENFQTSQFDDEDGVDGHQLPEDFASMTPEQLAWYQQQVQAESYRQLGQAQRAELEGSQASQGSQRGALQNGQNSQDHLGANASVAQNAQLLQQQQLMLQQQLLQNFTSPEAMAQAQQQLAQQYEMRMRKEMGNQLRIFASKMFKQLNKRQKKKLESKARQYLDQCTKDQKKLQRNKQTGQNGPQSEIDPAMLDFEFTADSTKFLDEISAALKKNKDLSEHFKRFQHVEFEETEQDQQLEHVAFQYFIANPMVQHQYMNYTMLYNRPLEEDDKKKIGDAIFNLIMPIAHQVDPILIKLIPEKTLQQFDIEYDDSGRIVSWKVIDEDSDESDSSDEGSSEDSGSQCGGELNSEGPQRNKSINDESSSELDDSGTPRSYAGGDHSQMFDDNENTVQPGLDASLSIGRGSKKQKGSLGGQMGQSCTQIGGVSQIPQHALTGRNKSLISQLNHSHPNQRPINRNELRLLDNFFRSLRDEKDWIAFCQLLYLYFEGVLSLKEFFQLYDEKFQSKLKQDTKDEMDRLLPTRDQNRRTLSNLLKAWNDTENQTFEKVADSSYYKIDEGFPIPTCTLKMQDDVYFKNLNDAYLSLATGSENKRFRNTNEEKIYSTEDKMYEYDTQIDNIRKSHDIVVRQCEIFDKLTPQEQSNYKFPVKKLSPLRFYWDKKFKKLVNEQYFDESRTLKEKEMKDLRKQFAKKLEDLKAHKALIMQDLIDAFRKNFTKSLDHKAFHFKDFMKKYLQKSTHTQKMRQISEDNASKRRFQKKELSLLFGSGEQPNDSDYRFYNTFGKDFGGKFDWARLIALDANPDYPIDMNFMDKVSDETIWRNQEKFPQARYLFNDARAFDITLKLVIQNVQHTAASDKRPAMKVLKFIMQNILMIKNFEEIEAKSSDITPLSAEMIEILLNPASYYQKKYDGELEHLCEVFTVDGFSTKQQSKMQSPLKNDYKDQIQSSQKQTLNLPEKSAEKALSAHSAQDVTPRRAGSDEEREDSSSSDSNTQKSSFNETSKSHSPGLPLKDAQFKTARLNDQCEEGGNINIEQDMETSIFIPKFVQQKGADEDDHYRLYFGPSNAFMFITFFYSIYERILKARQLVQQKVEQDFKDDFSKREWSVKFQSKQQALIDERFQYFVKSIYTAMCAPGGILDGGKYEDVARELLGSEAYLLFLVDKLVNHCTKHLTLFNGDKSCRASQRLFRAFEATELKSESQYLANFYKVSNECAIANASNGPQATGAAAAQKDPAMNQQAFRFMYSPKSKIMTIHNVMLNPFNVSESKRKDTNSQQMQLIIGPSGGVNPQEYLESMTEFTNRKQSSFYHFDQQLYNFDSESEDQEDLENKVTTYAQPIFLRRNLRKMKEIRKQAIDEKNEDDIKITQKNGIVSHMIPLVNQLSFTKHTEDIIETKRQGNTSVLGKRKMDHDIQINLLTKKLLNKRLRMVSGPNYQRNAGAYEGEARGKAEQPESM